MPELEKTDGRFHHHELIRTALRIQAISDCIIGAIQASPAGGYRYIVRCRLCGWAAGFDGPNIAAAEAFSHDRKRQKKGCNV